MRRSKLFIRWLSGWLLLCLLGVGVLGGAKMAVRAAPKAKPLAICPDPTIAEWTFAGNSTVATTGAGTFSYGSGTNGPSYLGGETALEEPAISFTGWNTATLNANDFLEFDVDTTNWSDVVVSFKYRSTGSGPTTLELQYSLDGATFTSFDVPRTLATNSNFHMLDFDLSSMVAINDNANAKFEIVCLWCNCCKWCSKN